MALVYVLLAVLQAEVLAVALVALLRSRSTVVLPRVARETTVVEAVWCDQCHGFHALDITEDGEGPEYDGE